MSISLSVLVVPLPTVRKERLRFPVLYIEYRIVTQALGISIHTTVCVLWSFYQCDIDGVFHRWMVVSRSLSVLVIPLPTNVLFPILNSSFLCHTL